MLASASGPSEQPLRISRTPARCAGVPEWLAQTNANNSGDSCKPARTIATACSGLFDDRPKTSSDGLPTANSISPVGPRATTDPQWYDSSTPLRTVTANRAWPGPSVAIVSPSSSALAQPTRFDRGQRARHHAMTRTHLPEDRLQHRRPR